MIDFLEITKQIVRDHHEQMGYPPVFGPQNANQNDAPEKKP